MRKQIGLIVEPEHHYVEYIEDLLRTQGFDCDPRIHHFPNTQCLQRRVDLNHHGLEAIAVSSSFDPDDVGVVVAEIYNPVRFHNALTPNQYMLALLDNTNNSQADRKQIVIDQQLLESTRYCIEFLSETLDKLPADVRVIIFTSFFRQMEEDDKLRWMKWEVSNYLNDRIPNHIVVPKDYQRSSAYGIQMLHDAIRPRTIIAPDDI